MPPILDEYCVLPFKNRLIVSPRQSTIAAELLPQPHQASPQAANLCWHVPDFLIGRAFFPCLSRIGLSVPPQQCTVSAELHPQSRHASPQAANLCWHVPDFLIGRAFFPTYQKSDCPSLPLRGRDGVTWHSFDKFPVSCEIHPSDTARITASVRLVACSFAKICARCPCTVRSLIASCTPIALLVNPLAARCSTSCLALRKRLHCHILWPLE